MIKQLKKYFGKLSMGEKIYASFAIPVWLSFSIYILVGIPIL
jgi:hypothetical protein